ITSMLPRDVVRRGAILLAAGMTFFPLLIPPAGDEVNGAKRWFDVGIGFQPSEFLKPAFAIAIAWILSWRARDPDLPVIHISGAVLFVVVMLLMLQPNLGDAILFFGCWAVLVFL